MKPKLQDRPVEKNISLPSSIVSLVDAQLADRLTNRPPHGAYSKLVTALLRAWLDGEVKVAIKVRKREIPYCPACLLDRQFTASCVNPECPMKEPPNEEVSDAVSPRQSTESLRGDAGD